MPGGQLSRAQRERIEERASRDRATRDEALRRRQAAQAAARPGADQRPAASHCLVLGPAKDPGPFPGIISAWRRLPWGGWSCHVLYAIPRDGADTMIVQQWLEDDQVKPLR